MNEQKPFYTVKDVANELHVSVSTVHNYIRDGLLKAHQMHGKGIWRIKPSEYRRFIRESK